MIRCSTCHEGTMTEGHVQDYDARAVFALDVPVLLAEAPALVCDRCGAVMLTGEVVEAAESALARLLVEQGGELMPKEVRFLRAMLGFSQAALEERLGMDAGAVARWEAGEASGARSASIALRSLVGWSLVEQDPGVAGKLAEGFVRAPVGRSAAPYRLQKIAA
jgi:putative zinc finger/helix-turn-helix YgiT family protein